MGCEELTNALAVLLLVSFLFNVLLGCVRCRPDDDDLIGESLLRHDPFSMVNLSGEDDDVYLGPGVVRDPYAILPSDYHFPDVHGGGRRVEPVLSNTDAANSPPNGAVPSQSDV